MSHDERKGDKGVDPNLALFAAWSRQEDERERESRRAAKRVKDEERKAQDLAKAKDSAAAELKRIRNDGRATAEQKTAADTAYREALAAVVAIETGTTPEWAPPAAAPEEVSSGDDASEAPDDGGDAASEAPETEPAEPAAEASATDDDAQDG